MSKKRCRSMVLIFTIYILLTNQFGPQVFAETEEKTFTLEGVKAAFLYDASSGEVLYEQNADEARPPASMTKMMTYYLVMDAIAEGRLSWDEKISASAYAAWTIGSQIGIQQGEKMAVRDLVDAMMILSANDAAVMLAERIAGSEIAFAQMMNQKARAIGLSSDANFVTATGLGRNSLGPYDPKSVTGETMFSARDAAMLAYHILNDYPELLSIVSMPEWKLDDEHIFQNTNLMLETSHYRKDGDNPFAYPSIDGLKTGYIFASGYTFTGTAERNGLRIISVVMGAESRDESFEKTRQLLDYGFAQYMPLPLIKAGEPIKSISAIPIINGDKEEIPVVALHDVIFLDHPRYGPASYEVSIDRRATLPFDAPIAKGERLGVATISYRGSIQQVDLVAAEDVVAVDVKSVAMNEASRDHPLLDLLKKWMIAFTHSRMYSHN